MTARDVAAAAGVSRATVSYVFSAHARVAVAAATRARVLGVARDLGYTPNPLARGLRGERTGVLGVVIGNIDANHVGLDIVRAIGRAAAAAGHQVLIADAGGAPARESAEARVLRDRAVDGIIFNGPADPTSVLLARDAGIPTVMVERYAPVAGVPGLCVDERAGSRLAVRHLAELGHRRLGYVGLADLHEADRARFEGAAAEAAALGLELRPGWVYRRRDQGARATFAFCRRMLGRPSRPSAVYAGGNLFAIEVLRAAREVGLRVPEDLSLVSFDDQYAEVTVPRLTTVCAAPEDLGAAAVGLLLRLLRAGPGEAPPPAETVLQPRLHVRESTAAAPSD